MKILALGATGAIGRQLVTKLVDAGHEVHVTTRQVRDAENSIRYIKGNAKDAGFLSGLLSDRWDVIVDFMVYDTQTFRDRAQGFLNATDQYVFLSSARVFAGSEHPLTETSPQLLDSSSDAAFLASDEYALTKARQENVLRQSGHRNWTIVRPYITFGPGRFQLGTLEKEDWLFRALQGRSIVFCRDFLDKKTTLTDGADVAAMISALIGAPQALGQDFNLVGPTSTTWAAVLETYLAVLEDHMGQRPRVILQDLEAFCQSANSEPQARYDRIYNRTFDTGKLEKFFDVTTCCDPLPTLRARLRADLASGKFGPLNPRGEALRDKAASEITSVLKFSGHRDAIKYVAYRLLPQNVIHKLRRS